MAKVKIIESMFDFNDIRSRLLKIMREDEIMVPDAALHIKISRPTLERFLRGGMPNFKCMCLIENWIKKEEEDKRLK